MKVFFSGSKRINDIGSRMFEILDRTMWKKDGILIGDCPGADEQIQRYLAMNGYPDVTVYCSGDEPRFNIGEWEVQRVTLDPALTSGYAFWRQKDIQMEFDCDSAVAVWDGKSKGTRQNIMELAALGKKCDVVLKDEDGAWLLDGIKEILNIDSVRIRMQGPQYVPEKETGNTVTPLFLKEARKRNAVIDGSCCDGAVEVCGRLGKDIYSEDVCGDWFDSLYWKQEGQYELHWKDETLCGGAEEDDCRDMFAAFGHVR